MFFYLLKNSTIIANSTSQEDKNIKIVLYGSICYIILHATLFIGGNNALLISLKPYFWLFFFLDIMVIYITDRNIIDMIKNNTLMKITSTKSSIVEKNNNNNNDDGLSIFDSFLKNDVKNKKSLKSNTNLNTNSNNNLNNNLKNNYKLNNNKLKKKVSFQEPKQDEYYSSSDSDSDIGTDIDLDGFKQTLYNL